MDVSFCRKKRRKSRRKKGTKHIYSFFITKKKKYDLYYIPFDQKVVDKNSLSSKSMSCVNKVGLKSLSLDLLKVECLKSLKFCNQRFLKSIYMDKNFKEVIYTLPDYFLTSKPKSIRMGKGKGESKLKVFFLKKNVPIYSLKFVYSRFNSFFINRKFTFFKINLFVYFLINTLKGKLSVSSSKFKFIY